MRNFVLPGLIEQTIKAPKSSLIYENENVPEDVSRKMYDMIWGFDVPLRTVRETNGVAKTID